MTCYMAQLSLDDPLEDNLSCLWFCWHHDILLVLFRFQGAWTLLQLFAEQAGAIRKMEKLHSLLYVIMQFRFKN